MLTKTLCNIFSLYCCAKIVQYFVIKVQYCQCWQYKNTIAQYCIYCSILWTILERLGLLMNRSSLSTLTRTHLRPVMNRSSLSTVTRTQLRPAWPQCCGHWPVTRITRSSVSGFAWPARGPATGRPRPGPGASVLSLPGQEGRIVTASGPGSPAAGPGAGPTAALRPASSNLKLVTVPRRTQWRLNWMPGPVWTLWSRVTELRRSRHLLAVHRAALNLNSC